MLISMQNSIAQGFARGNLAAQWVDSPFAKDRTLQRSACAHLGVWKSIVKLESISIAWLCPMDLYR